MKRLLQQQKAEERKTRDHADSCKPHDRNKNSPKPDRKSLETLANEVIRGDWGNGIERVRRLTAAGYDSKTVQKRVNEILRS